MVCSLTSRTLHLHPQTVKTLARRDKKRPPILPSKTDIGRPRFLHLDLLDLLAGGIENRDPMPGEINISRIVNRHAVRSQFTEWLFLSKRAVCLDAVLVGFVPVYVRHIEGF